MRLLKTFCAFLVLTATAHAADHNNLEEGLPVEVEDAYPTAYTNTEFQLQGRYERTSKGDDQFVLRPALEYGFAPNWQGKIELPFRLGEGDTRGSGDIGLELFHNFNTETLSTPAFALSARGQSADRRRFARRGRARQVHRHQNSGSGGRTCSACISTSPISPTPAPAATSATTVMSPSWVTASV